jgi:NADPH:quinone reductase-like Zn-dependent oxidoreductase
VLLGQLQPLEHCLLRDEGVVLCAVGPDEAALQVPQLDAGEVLLNVLAAGVNNTDINLRLKDTNISDSEKLIYLQ